MPAVSAKHFWSSYDPMMKVFHNQTIRFTIHIVLTLILLL